MTIIKTPTGFKLGSKGKVINSVDKAAALYGTLSKSERRKVRKAAHAAGFRGLAAVPAA